eukprot:scaffold167927_cov32-Tisochrysis_lutea.AAC.1
MRHVISGSGRLADLAADVLHWRRALRLASGKRAEVRLGQGDERLMVVAGGGEHHARGHVLRLHETREHIRSDERQIARWTWQWLAKRRSAAEGGAVGELGEQFLREAHTTRVS